MKTITTFLAVAFLAAISTGHVRAAKVWNIESTQNFPSGTVPNCNGHPVGSTWSTAIPPTMNECGRIVKTMLHTCYLVSKGPPPAPACPPHARVNAPARVTHGPARVAPSNEAAHDAAVAAHDAAVAAHDAAVAAHTRTLQQLNTVAKDPKLADPTFDGRRAPAIIDGTTGPKQDMNGHPESEVSGSGATKKYKLDDIKVPD